MIGYDWKLFFLEFFISDGNMSYIEMPLIMPTYVYNMEQI